MSAAQGVGRVCAFLTPFFAAAFRVGFLCRQCDMVMLLRTVASVLAKVGILNEVPSDEFVEAVSVEMYVGVPGRGEWL